MIRKLMGALVFLLGVLLAGWIFYNLFIERLPKTQGRSPVPAVLLAAGLIYTGLKWFRGGKA